MPKSEVRRLVLEKAAVTRLRNITPMKTEIASLLGMKPSALSMTVVRHCRGGAAKKAATNGQQE
jgi:hypothetical protein